MRDLRKKIYIILVALIFVLCFPVIIVAQDSKAIEIYTASDLMKIGKNPNWPLDGYYLLMNDIVLETPKNAIFNFEVIAGSTDMPFTGIFDGNNKTIRNLVINTVDGIATLFGYIDDDKAIVKDLGLIDVDFTGSEVGGIVHTLRRGTIDNCYTTGKIVSTKDAAGVVLRNGYGTVRHCYSYCAIEAIKDVGGIASMNAIGTIEKCYFRGEIRSKAAYTGGIVAWNYSLVEKSYFEGRMFSNNPEYYYSIYSDGTGGIVGNNVGIVRYCYTIGTISGDSNVGGIVGQNSGEVQECYSLGELRVSHLYSAAGGIVGDNRMVVDKSVSLAPEIVFGRNFGGRVMGRSEGASLSGTVKLICLNCTNYAWDGMKISFKDSPPPTYAYDEEIQINGYDIGIKRIFDEDFYAELGWNFNGDDPIWEFSGEYKLPKLVGVGGQENLVTPSHLM